VRPQHWGDPGPLRSLAPLERGGGEFVLCVSQYLITALVEQDDAKWLPRKSVAGAVPEGRSKEKKHC
jgi:hypothetical protein